jgi:hypothetical protein
MAPERRLEVLKGAPPNSWLALSHDESTVVGGGATYGEAVREAEQKGEDDPVLIKTPDDWSPMVLTVAHRV